MKFGVLTPVVVFAGSLVFLAGWAMPADAGDWYADAGVSARIVYTDGNYGYDQMRIRAGYSVNRAISLEVQAASGGSDRDHDIIDGFRKWIEGPSYGAFVRFSRALRRNRVEVYGLVGVTRMETTYRFLDLGVEDKDRIWSGAAGAGMQYNFPNSGFSAALDVLWTYGEGTYPNLSGYATYGDESVITGTVTAGLGYRF